jgi:polyisoprenoid-binding protein YceI
MKKLNLLLMFLAVIILSAFTVVSTQWKISNGYSIKFFNEHAKGEFEKISGTIHFDENDLVNSSFNMQVDVKSIATGNFLKNSHAKGEKWFDSDKYPKITFVSTKISKSANGFVVEGNLKMKDVTKAIEIPLTFKNNVFSGKFSVNRMDYNIGSMEGMSKKVGNKIDLEISVPVIK